MAQNSIARLAVQIVTDTAGMTQGFNTARANTLRFANGLDSANSRLLHFGRVGKDATKELAKLGGAGGLAFKFAGLAGPVGLAAVAITGLAAGMARAATASQDLRIERLRELGRISPDILTTKEALGGVSEELGKLNETFFKLTVGDSVKSLAVNFKNAFRNIGETFAPETFAKITAERALAKDDSLLALKRKADELAKSVRTPLEVFGDTVGELIRMREEGFITTEILSRGAEKAAEDFRRLNEASKKHKEIIGGGAALEAGTAAARSFVLGSKSKEETATQREIAATLKRIELIERDIAKKPPITFKKGSL